MSGLNNFKVLHINAHSIGGAAKAAIRTHVALLDAGIDSGYLFLYPGNEQVSKAVQFYPPKQSFSNRLKKRIFKKGNNGGIYLTVSNEQHHYGYFSSPEASFNILNHPSYLDADIIHFHSIARFIDFQSFFQYNKKPLVWTLHDMNPFTGGCHFSSGCVRHNTNCQNCPLLEKKYSGFLASKNLENKKMALRNVKLNILTLSRWMEEHSKSSMLFRDFAHERIHNTLDTDIFKPRNKHNLREVLDLPQNTKVLLFVSDSVHAWRKGFDMLNGVLQDIQIDNIHLAIVGSNHLHLNKHLSVTHFGNIIDERLMSMIYGAADVFILPSREDNLPNVMLESLSCGTPVITFPTGGMLDVVKHGQNGIICSEISKNALQRAIQDFMANKYLFDSYNIRSDAVTLFSPESQVKKYIKLYHGVLNR